MRKEERILAGWTYFLEDGKNLSTIMDDNWKDYEIAKEIYVWEGDEGDVKVDFDLAVKFQATENLTLNAGVKVKVDKKRDDIFRGFMDREVFYTLNRTSVDDELGTRQGYQVRHAGDLYWYFSEVGVDTN